MIILVTQQEHGIAGEDGDKTGFGVATFSGFTLLEPLLRLSIRLIVVLRE